MPLCCTTSSAAAAAAAAASASCCSAHPLQIRHKQLKTIGSRASSSGTSRSSTVTSVTGSKNGVCHGTSEYEHNGKHLFFFFHHQTFFDTSLWLWGWFKLALTVVSLHERSAGWSLRHSVGNRLLRQIPLHHCCWSAHTRFVRGICNGAPLLGTICILVR